MAAPSSLNLLGRIGLLSSFVLAFFIFFSAAYTLYLNPYSQLGAASVV
jgi:hypothetical protein